jgi:hypothetical protein
VYYSISLPNKKSITSARTCSTHGEDEIPDHFEYHVINHEINSAYCKAAKWQPCYCASATSRRHTAQPEPTRSVRHTMAGRSSVDQLKAASRAAPTPRPSASFAAIPAIGAAEFPLGVAGLCEEAPETVMATFCPPAQCDPVAHAKYLVPGLSNVKAVLPVLSDDTAPAKLHAV